MRNILHLRGYFNEDLDGTDQPELFSLTGFSGAVGQTALVSDSSSNYLCVGLGSEKKFSTVLLRISLEALSSYTLDGYEIDAHQIINRVETILPGSDAQLLIETTLLVGNPNILFSASTTAKTRSHTPEAAAIANSVRLTQNITNAAGSDMNPEAFARIVDEVCLHPSLRVTIISGQQLVTQGFPAVSAMGAGSPYTSQFIQVDYVPQEMSPSVVLVGKGVTFDTGGLSLKTPSAMAGMRHDICGAATILGVMQALPQLGVRATVTALLPVIENMVGPQSIRPGDDIPTRSGVPLRILDTDFEGRVILADALTKACEINPSMIIDFSTLTYQSIIALGPKIAAYFSNSNTAASEFEQAADESGEAFWRLPLADMYDAQIRTRIGLKNHPETDSGRAITAALLLQEFVAPEIPWIHIDATGPTWNGSAGDDGATGFGVTTLLRLLENRGSS